MSTVATALRPVPVPASDVLRRDPAAQAFMVLRIAFTVVFGLLVGALALARLASAFPGTRST